MKHLFIVIGIFVLSNSNLCQVMNNETIISRALETGTFDGHLNKQIGGMGDSLAVTITKILSGKKIETADIDRIITLLLMTFSDPSFINDDADRQPRTTLFVLQCLDSSTTNQEVKKRIADTKKYILDRYAKYLKSDFSHRNVK